jgi:hypothetical protein
MRSFEEAMNRIPSQTEKIINLLRNAGADGVTNIELAEVSLKYDARISELRRKGFIIETIYISSGVYKYVLIKMPSNDHYFKNATDETLLMIQDQYEGGWIHFTDLAALLESMHFHITRKSGWYKHQQERKIH